MDARTAQNALPTPELSPLAKYMYIATGLLLVAIGIVGIVVPVMPTTIFIICAAACFTKSSPRLEGWLLAHSYFGPRIRDWRDHRSLPIGLKAFICATAVASAVFVAITIKTAWVVATAVSIAVVTLIAMILIPTRPAPRP